VVDKLMVQDKLDVKDIMTGLRRNHYVGVTFGRAWQAREKAKKNIEGNAAKQYTLLLNLSLFF
jgi:hypothetical protein